MIVPHEHRRSANGAPFCRVCNQDWPCSSFVENDHELRFGLSNKARTFVLDLVLDACGNLSPIHSKAEQFNQLHADRLVIREENGALPGIRDSVRRAWAARKAAAQTAAG